MITLEFISALPGSSNKTQNIRYFSSYNFDRNIMTPASAFRFTAPGVDREKRLMIRSGDQVNLFIDDSSNNKIPVGVGFIDETDTHITARSVDYVLTGRDTISQLIDNDTVDVNSAAIKFSLITLNSFIDSLIANTRLKASHAYSQIPLTTKFAARTSSGETKLNYLQRMLEWCNGLVWADPTGQLVVGKPNFTQKSMGKLFITEKGSNVLEGRVRRNLNQAIRSIVTTLQSTDADPASIKADTLRNMDRTLQDYQGTFVGRSVSRTFSYANGTDIINQGQIGKGSYAPHRLSQEYSAREIAKENMKILDVELVVEGHFNQAGTLYDIDQVYDVQIDEELVSEPLYVYSVSYELTQDHGMMTRLRLCRLWTICAYADQLQKVVR